jgi:soluble lytic murein transglycosylase-like protein
VKRAEPVASRSLILTEEKEEKFLKIDNNKTASDSLLQRTGRQKLPVSPKDEPTFSSLLLGLKESQKATKASEVKNLTPQSLADYRSNAHPVRLKPLRKKTYDQSAGTGASKELNTPEELRALIEANARKHGLPTQLVAAVIKVESNFDSRAVSSEGARGLMQLMPTTARELGVRNSFDAAQNINGGCRYLKEMLDRFDGKLELAIAAYNAGPGAVEKYGRIPPYQETQKYVRKVMAYC